MGLSTIQSMGRTASIMVVEDNPGDVMLIKRAFKHAAYPYEITMAPSGEQAVAMLKGENGYHTICPDIILLDINLPRMSGHDILHFIKSDDRLKRIPTIMLSSSNAESDIRKSYDAHANSYIVKPASLDEAVDMVRKVEEFWFSLSVLLTREQKTNTLYQSSNKGR